MLRGLVWFAGRWHTYVSLLWLVSLFVSPSPGPSYLSFSLFSCQFSLSRFRSLPLCFCIPWLFLILVFCVCISSVSDLFFDSCLIFRIVFSFLFSDFNVCLSGCFFPLSCVSLLFLSLAHCLSSFVRHAFLSSSVSFALRLAAGAVEASRVWGLPERYLKDLNEAHQLEAAFNGLDCYWRSRAHRLSRAYEVWRAQRCD